MQRDYSTFWEKDTEVLERSMEKKITRNMKYFN